MKKLRGSDGARATVRVKNTGFRSGSTVVQLYLGMPSPSAGVPQPPWQLKGFQKVTLAARKSARVATRIIAAIDAFRGLLD